MPRALLIALLACASVAQAQTYWSESFDIYNAGGLCPNPACANAGASGGWTGWDNSDTAAGIVNTTYARSGSQSISVTNSQDAVQPFVLNDPTGHPQAGAWVVTTWIYLDSATFATGDQYLVINNQYNHFGPYSWVGQFKMSPLTGLLTDDFRTSNTTSLVFNRWVEFRFEVDLTNNCASAYYDGNLLSRGLFITPSTTSTVRAIANIDLYADVGGTSIAYYDDMSITVGTPAGWQRNQTNSNLDFDGVASDGCNPAISVRAIGTGTTFTANTPLAAFPFDIGIDFAPPVAALLTTPGGQFLNVNLFSPTAFYFNSFSSALNFQAWPGAPIILPLSTPFPLEISAQMIVIDPASPDSFTLSQAAGLRVQ